MDRMNETQAISDVHVGWPTIFPEVPEFLVYALSCFAAMSRDSAKQAADPSYIGNRDIAAGHAYAYNSAGEWIAEDLARGMWFGDGNAMVWVERQSAYAKLVGYPGDPTPVDENPPSLDDDDWRNGETYHEPLSYYIDA